MERVILSATCHEPSGPDGIEPTSGCDTYKRLNVQTFIGVGSGFADAECRSKHSRASIFEALASESARTGPTLLL